MRKKIKGIKIVSLIIILMLTFLIMACDEEKVDYVLDLKTPQTVDLKVGDSLTLDFNLSNNGTYNIETSNDCIIVTNNIIKAMKIGSTTVTITCIENTEIFKQIEVNVIEVIEDIGFGCANNIEVGEESKLDIDYDSNIKVDFEISINNDNISYDKETNTIKGMKVGTSEITITDKISELSASIIINVYRKTEKIEAFCNSSDILYVNGEIDLNIVYDEESTTDIIVLTDNNACYDYQTKTIRGINAGLCTITIKDQISGLSTSVNLTVFDKLTELELNNNDYELFINEYFDFDIIRDSDYVNTDLKVTLENDNLIFEGDRIKAVNKGTTEITITDKISGLEKKVTITILEESSNIDELIDWALKEIGNNGKDEIIFPMKHPTEDCTYTWEFDDSLCDEEGYLAYVEFDTVMKITCKCQFNGTEKSKTIDFTISGYALDDLAYEFKEQFKGGRLYKSYNLITNYPDYYGGSTVKWESGNTEIFTNTGEYIKPVNDTTITIYYTCILGDPNISKSYEIELDVMGMTISDVVEPIKEWINKNVGVNGAVDENTYFPNYMEEYDAELIWLDSYGNPLKIEKYVGNPIYSQGLDVQVKIIFKERSSIIDLHYDMKFSEFTTKWDAIELFINTITSLEVQTYSYTLVSWTGTNFGYLPFYDTNNAKIIDQVLEYTYGKQRTGIMKTSTEYIVVHDTGNPNKGANAEMHNRYITNLNNNPDSTYISWHFTVGNDGIYQHLPLDEVAYHAGDGSHVFGDTYLNSDYNAWSIGGGNRNGIGIESCIDNGCDYTETMRILAKLVAELLIKYNLSIDRVKQHNDFSGKNCPQVMRENNRWKEFILLVQLEYFAKTVLKGVDFEWTSLTDCLDNHGRVTSKQNVGTELKYQVKATYDGESRTYSFTNKIVSR